MLLSSFTKAEFICTLFTSFTSPCRRGDKKVCEIVWYITCDFFSGLQRMLSWSTIHLIEVEQTNVLQFCTILVKFLPQHKSCWRIEFIVLTNSIVNLAYLICFLQQILLWTECLFPSEFKSWSLIPHLMIFGYGAIGRWLGHAGGALINGISVLLKETPLSCCS